ncbi:hypothetical protein BKA62DRAFT_770087 [Auriculariales sp. MPI-PUGE-AT-0066]|nr:hypothetical protein BKA62DRAFT_770087 [Auriculariales sp. MPI-PUGE-AT-0066]
MMRMIAGISVQLFPSPHPPTAPRAFPMVVIAKGSAAGNERQRLLAGFAPAYDGVRSAPLAGPATSTSTSGVIRPEDDSASEEDQPPAYEDVTSGKRRPSANWRFLQTLAVALFIYMLGTLLAVLLMRLRSSSSARVLATRPQEGDGRVVGQYDPNDTIQRWIHLPFSSRNYAYTSNIELNLIAEPTINYYFLTRGNTAKGAVQYSMVERSGWDSKLFKFNVTDEVGEMGFGLYMPDGSDQVDMHVDIELLVPVGGHGLQTRLGRMRAQTNNFAHHFSLDERVAINVIDLDVAGTDAVVQSATPFAAGEVKILTDGGDMRGVIAASNKIALESNTGRIVMNTHLGYLLENADMVPSLDLKTLSGDTVLLTTLSTASSFKIAALSDSGPIGLSVIQPLNSVLDLNAQSVQGPVHAALSPPFEGSIVLETSGDSSTVDFHVGLGMRDPAQRGRGFRIVDEGIDPKSFHARVYWASSIDQGPSREGGNVVLKSGNATVLLSIQQDVTGPV